MPLYGNISRNSESSYCYESTNNNPRNSLSEYEAVNSARFAAAKICFFFGLLNDPSNKLRVNLLELLKIYRRKNRTIGRGS